MAPLQHTTCGLLALIVGAALCASAPAHAQQTSPTSEPMAGIVGKVIDRQSRSPVGGAQTALLGTRRQSASDSAGRFTHAGLAAGTYVLQVRAIGYGAASWVVELEDSQVLELIFELTPTGYMLAPVTVEGRPTLWQQRIQEFERRRREHRGVFITAEQIKTAHAATVGDLLRNVPGVRVVCRAGNCVVQMSRSARGSCRPDWVVDGFPATRSATPQLPTVGIVAMEIYRSASETPTELLKSESMCGVIAIWTMSGT